MLEPNGGATITLVIPLSAAFGARPAGAARRGRVLESLGESQYKNDEQFDNSLRSVLFQIPARPRIPCMPDGPSQRGLLPRRPGPRSARRGARPRPRHPELQRPAVGLRAGAQALVHGDHRRGDRSGCRGALDIDDRRSSTSSTCATTTATGSSPAGGRRRRHPPPTLASRLKAIYGDVGQRRRVRRHGLRAARLRQRARRAAAGDLAQAVRGPA